MGEKLTFGFARMREEAGERRDFLPETIAALGKAGARVILEHGYGSGMGYEARDYKAADSDVVFASHEEVYQQDFALVHNLTEIESRFGLPDNRPHIIIGSEVVEFGSNVRRHIRQGRFSARLNCFLFPEINHDRVGDFFQFLFTEIRVREYPGHFH